MSFDAGFPPLFYHQTIFRRRRFYVRPPTTSRRLVLPLTTNTRRLYYHQIALLRGYLRFYTTLHVLRRVQVTILRRTRRNNVVLQRSQMYFPSNLVFLVTRVRLVLMRLRIPTIGSTIQTLVMVVRQRQTVYSFTTLLGGTMYHTLVLRRPPRQVTSVPRRLPLMRLIPNGVPRLVQGGNTTSDFPTYRALRQRNRFYQNGLFLPFGRPRTRRDRIHVLFLRIATGHFRRPTIRGIVAIRGTRVHSLYPFRPHITHYERSPIFLISYYCAFLLYNVFITSNSANVNKAVIRRRSLGVPVNLIRSTIRTTTRVSLRVMSQGGSASRLYLRILFPRGGISLPV